MNIFSFFYPVTIASFKSKYNNEILVKEFLGKKYIEVEGLMQSGRIVTDLFKKGFKKLEITSSINIKSILLMGLGGGTVIKTLQNLFPDAEISAIDIDPVMVLISKEHFDLDVDKISIKIGDVFDPKFRFGNNYDLIIVDVFKGYIIPEKLGEKKFLAKLKSSLSKNGMVIFNRLYFQKYVSEADQFLDKVEEIFQDVKRTKVYLNLLIRAR